MYISADSACQYTPRKTIISYKKRPDVVVGVSVYKGLYFVSLGDQP